MISLSNSDCLEAVKTLESNNISSIITDPPYGLNRQFDITECLSNWINGFDYNPSGTGILNNDWDNVVPGPKYWEEMLRVIVPGGFLAAFAAPKMADVLSIAIRLSGFIKKDEICLQTLQWIQAQGQPKSKLLKPAYESILIFQKPFKGSISKNVSSWGTGILNIDEARTPIGRYPTNFILVHHPLCGEDSCVDGCPCKRLDDQSGIREGCRPHLIKPSKAAKDKIKKEGNWGSLGANEHFSGFADSGGASRFFNNFYFCSKASKSEKHEGLENLKENTIHPTIKPIALMEWLVKLTTPEGYVVLDPFMGAGTTGIACFNTNRKFIGVESNTKYYETAKARLTNSITNKSTVRS